MEAQLIKFYQTKSLYYFFLLFSGLFILFLVRINPFIGEGNGNPLQYFCLRNPMVRGAWWAAVHRVAQIQTRLKWLSMLEGNGNPLQYSCLENPMDRGAWWAAIHRVAQSWTQLKQLRQQQQQQPLHYNRKLLNTWPSQMTEIPAYAKKKMSVNSGGLHCS